MEGNSSQKDQSVRSSRTVLPPLNTLQDDLLEKREILETTLEENRDTLDTPSKVQSAADKLKGAKSDFQRGALLVMDKLIKIGSLQEAQELELEKKDLISQYRLRMAQLAALKVEVGGSELAVSLSKCSGSQVSDSPSTRDRQQLFRELKEKEAAEEIQSKIDSLELRSTEAQIRQETETRILLGRTQVERRALEREKSKRMTLAALNATGNDEDIELDLPTDSPSDRLARLEGSLNANTHSLSPPLATCAESASQVPSFPRPGDYVEGRPNLDSTTLYLAKIEFFKPPCIQFNGKPTHYHTWKRNFDAQVEELCLKPHETLRALEAHTSGAALKVVEAFRDASIGNTEVTLEGIWRAMASRFGKSSMVLSLINKRVAEFREIKGNDLPKCLQELSDICLQIGGQMAVIPGLNHYNTEIGIRSLADKLPTFIFNRWRTKGCEYEDLNGGEYPPFHIFQEFIMKEAERANNPGYIQRQSKENLGTMPKASQSSSKPRPSDEHWRALATSTIPKRCPIHQDSNHELLECKSFAAMDLNAKETLIKQAGLCFRCFGNHVRRNCRESVQCGSCLSSQHMTVMHKESRHNSSTVRSSPEARSIDAITLCSSTQGCMKGRSCGKTILVDLWHNSNPKRRIRAYAILDEESTSSFAHPKVFDILGISGPIQQYRLTTLENHKSSMSGMIVKGLHVQGVGKMLSYSLPEVFENSMIPDTKDEIAEPHLVRAYEHLREFADKFRPLDQQAEVLVLIGRNAGNVMKTQQYGHKAPFAYDTALGWAVVGSLCPFVQGDVANEMRVLRTAATHDHFRVQPIAENHVHQSSPTEWNKGLILGQFSQLKKNVFSRLDDDERPGPSQEDRLFLKLAQEHIGVTEHGFLSLKLPFKDVDPFLPNNRAPVLRRTMGTLNRMRREPQVLEECLAAMQKSIDNGKVEVVPDDEPPPAPGKAWWIPCFAVRHKTKGKVRMVFDSSASYMGTSLNSKLLQGPDYCNKLRGVIARFREEDIGFSCDIESMFHMFFVPKEDRDFMRFFWFLGNDPQNPVVGYRALVHIFGNRPSPAIAMYALHFACRSGAVSEKSKDFIGNNFYVDDGFGSASNPDEAIQILEESRSALSQFNIRLHKIVSNNEKVLKAFPPSEIADGLKQFDFESSSSQGALGMLWNPTTDEIWVRSNLPDKPFTKRGVLGIVNAPYDNIGIVSPIILGGRLLQRRMIPSKTEMSKDLENLSWDDPLPERFHSEWNRWKSGLEFLDTIKIPRGLKPSDLPTGILQELHVFADSSQDAIGVVAYVRSVHNGVASVNFLRGESKVAPKQAKSIPRLELCAALRASQVLEEALNDLVNPPNRMYLYSDSMVVLGYLRNQERRFTNYVARRVDLILNVSSIQSWHYVPTDQNPADIASRPSTPKELARSKWLTGPLFLKTVPLLLPGPEPTFDGSLPEVKEADLVTLKTATSVISGNSWVNFIERYGRWDNIVAKVGRIVSRLLNFKNSVKGSDAKTLMLTEVDQADVGKRAELWLIKDAQWGEFYHVMHTLSHNRDLPVNHPLKPLSPFLDTNGILRVGGRLRNSNFPADFCHPILLPQNHVLSKAILEHYHRENRHQGRHITAGALRAAGFHIKGSGRLVRKLVGSCELCRRLRAPLMDQYMADLPPDRLEKVAPFTNCGLDVFGPFKISEGRSTRARPGVSKIWALILTCLTSRAIHLELLPAIDTSAFKNALRRFTAIRGSCRILRSDRGTNFVGSHNQDLDLSSVQADLKLKGCQWLFNPPDASHFGGVWERKIGQVRRCLEATLLLVGPRLLSRDEIHTLMMEAMAVVNSTPLWEISTDPNDPLPISPAALLTLRESPYQDQPTSFNEQDLKAYGPRRWKRVQYLADQFWIRYQNNYLQALQERNKWKKDRRTLQEGDLVLMRKKGVRRGFWPFAKIVELIPSADGLVRSVVIEVAKDAEPGVYPCKLSRYTRPISSLVFLAGTRGSLNSTVARPGEECAGQAANL